ncbi:hypothetical protein NPIL_14721 [Nephila pilipes]|uniref:Uncharacterized protein n=1 Tax=Nephila pilipes TaxID=299642 RepID=A0A8X6QAL6_NEPPI|nr:hypothetical protein NPIL_14721 [Nephila pilipes]
MKLIEDFNDIPSLCFIACTQIAITIWNRKDIKSSIGSVVNTCVTVNLKMAPQVKQVSTIVDKIEMDSRLKHFIKSIIEPVGYQIFLISNFSKVSTSILNPFNSFEMDCSVNFWTNYGTVNTKRVEELIARDEQRHESFRFILACNDCFQEIIERLFHSISYAQRNYYLSIEKRQLASYWTHRMINDLGFFAFLILRDKRNFPDSGYSADQFAFLYTLVTGSKSGIEYFMNYLRPNEYEVVWLNRAYHLTANLTEKKDYVADMPSRPSLHYVDALYFSLAKLSEEQRMKILRKYPGLIMRRFMQYPFFGLFNKYAHVLASYLNLDQLLRQFHYIIVLEETRTDLFGVQLFDNLWFNLPQARRDIINTYVEEHILEELIPLLRRRIGIAEKRRERQRRT